MRNMKWLARILMKWHRVTEYRTVVKRSCIRIHNYERTSPILQACQKIRLYFLFVTEFKSRVGSDRIMLKSVLRLRLTADNVCGHSACCRCMNKLTLLSIKATGYASINACIPLDQCTRYALSIVPPRPLWNSKPSGNCPLVSRTDAAVGHPSTSNDSRCDIRSVLPVTVTTLLYIDAVTWSGNHDRS